MDWTDGCATSPDLPDQCSPLSILDSSGKYLNSGCVINGFGYVDTVTAPIAGTYRIVVDPADRKIGPVTLAAAGAYTIVVDPSADSTGSVTLTLK